MSEPTKRVTARRGKSSEAKSGGSRVTLANGIRLVHEEGHALPLVDLELVLRTGSVFDPRGKEGLTRMIWRMVRMGTKRLRADDLEEAVARLGGRLSMESAMSYVRIHASVLARNVEPLFALVADVVRNPAFRADDFAHVVRETTADIIAARDSDRAIAARNFRRQMFGDHPYARSVVGSRKTVAGLRRADLRPHYETHFVGSNLVLGVAGAITRDQLLRLVERHFGDLPRGKPPKEQIAEPKRVRGRRLLLVDKPERSQTQLFIGCLGSKLGDRDYYALSVANTAFGGTFTSRLMNEVRSKRGWSYGASARVGHDRHREAWSMWTAPAATDAPACIKLQLDLLEDFVANGVRKAEHRFAQKYLINSHCFELDTPEKRLGSKVEEELFGLPPGHYDHYVDHIRGVSHEDANRAVARRLSSRDVSVVLVASADTSLAALKDLPDVDQVDVAPFDDD